MNPLHVVVGLLVYGLVGTPLQPPQFDPDVKTSRMSENLYLLEGAGGNVLAFVWEDGVLLVDDKIAPASPQIKAAIARITPKPIRFVVNTHWHGDHSGGNETLAGEGAVIVAHENVRRRMSVDSLIAVIGYTAPASPPQALPIVTFTRDIAFHLGDEEIAVTHVDAAHTDGDSFIQFRKANVLHMGDCFLNPSYPLVDYSNGGSYSGTIAAAGRALEMSDPATRIVPGHGPVAGSAELKTWRDMLAAIYERVGQSVKAGKSLDAIKAEHPTREWDATAARWFVTPDHVVEEAYRSLTE